LADNDLAPERRFGRVFPDEARPWCDAETRVDQDRP
jgi:hypothetical protein